MRQAIQHQPMAGSKFVTALYVCIALDNLGMFTEMARQVGTFGDAVFNTVAGKCTDTYRRVMINHLEKVTKYIVHGISNHRHPKNFIPYLILFPTR